MLREKYLQWDEVGRLDGGALSMNVLHRITYPRLRMPLMYWQETDVVGSG
jgi:hypothetical protein